MRDTPPPPPPQGYIRTILTLTFLTYLILWALGRSALGWSPAQAEAAMSPQLLCQPPTNILFPCCLVPPCPPGLYTCSALPPVSWFPELLGPRLSPGLALILPAWHFGQCLRRGLVSVSAVDALCVQLGKD